MANSSSTNSKRRFISSYSRGIVGPHVHGEKGKMRNLGSALRNPAPMAAKSPVFSAYNSTVSSFFVQNFGCRATQADGAAIERDLLARGFDRAAAPADASVVVLNTCTVTASADQDVRASIRRIHRNNPDVQILVTGCYAQRAPEELAAMSGVSIVVGHSNT